MRLVVVGGICLTAGLGLLMLLSRTKTSENTTAPGSAYYTPERIATAKANLSEFEWAKKIWKQIQNGDGAPDYYIGRDYGDLAAFSALPDDVLWDLQPDSVIPRYVPLDTAEISPLTGRKLSQKFGFKAWFLDPINHPYKVQDRSTGEWFPKNDYYQYYKSGIGDSGRFEAEKADPSFLVNAEDGSGHYVDRGAGDGFEAAPAGEMKSIHFFPIRLYSKFVYTAYTVPLLRSFSQATLLDEDPQARAEHARKGLILLARLAFIYPDYRAPGEGEPDRRAWASQSTVTGVRGPAGLLTDRIWETFSFEAICMAYDALRPFLYTDHSLVDYLRTKGIPAANASELDDYIRKHLLQSGMNALLTHKIKGNLGMHQSSALAAATAFNDVEAAEPNSRSMVDFLYSGPENLQYLMTNSLYRDGGGHESVNYNVLKLALIRADRLMSVLRHRFPETFPESKYPDFFAGEKAQAIFDYYIAVTPQDRFIPDFGDSGNLTPPKKVSKPGYLPGKDFYFAWEKYGHGNAAMASRYLRAAGISGTLPAGDLFEAFPDEASRAKAVTATEAEPKPRLLAGYGVGILEQGHKDHRRTLLQNGTALAGHRQYDPLSLGLYVASLSLLPDLGYPRTWNYRWPFDGHSMAANTVTIDETRGTMGTVVEKGNTRGGGVTGAIWRLFAQQGPLQVSAVNFDAYPPGFNAEPFRRRYEKIVDPVKADSAARDVSLFERMDVLVEVDEEHSYVVDLFSVNGGTQHDLSWHGPLVKPVDPPLAWINQEAGTLAGEDIPRFAEYTDRWGRKNLGGAFPSYLSAIKRAPLEVPAVWEWNSGLPSRDGLRIHIVPTSVGGEAIRGQGRSPARPDELEYLLIRRQATGGTATQFLSVLEPFQGEPFLQGIRLVSPQPLILEVTHAGGRDRLTLISPEGDSRSTAPRQLGVRLERFPADSEDKVTNVQIGDHALQTTIQRVNYAERTIVLPAEPAWEAACQPGRWIRVFNEDRSSLYQILSVRKEGEELLLTLALTPLLAKAPVLSVGPDRLDLGANILLANGTLDPAGNLELHPWQPRDFLAGARIEMGTESVRLRGGASLGNEQNEQAHSVLFLNEAPKNPALLKALKNSEISIWDYGVGDSVEVVQIDQGL